MRPASLTALACAFSLAVPTAEAIAQAQPEDPATPGNASPLGLTPDQTSAFIGQLTAVQEAFAKTKKEIVASALTRLSNASASEAAAADLYLAAWKIVNIDRRPVAPSEDAPKADEDAWRERLIEWMTETGSPRALRLQLAWMALTLEVTTALEAGKDITPHYPRARELAQEAVALVRAASQLENPESKVVASVRSRNDDGDNRRRNGDGNEDRVQKELRNILSTPAMASLFGQAYNLHNYVQAPKDFARAPLDLSTLYNVMLLPYYRAQKKELLSELWDEWIGYTAADKQASLDEVGFLMWTATDGKDLQWQKHIDLLKHGVNGANSAAELIRMVKDNPNHPSLGSWISDLNQVMALATGS